MSNLTSDFRPYQLEDYDLSIFVEAQRKCQSSLNFWTKELVYLNETCPNQVHTYAIEKIEFYTAELEKWTPVIEKAEARDKARADKFASYFTR